MVFPSVIPAAFSPRESGGGIQRLYWHFWVPAFAGTTGLSCNVVW